MEYTVTAALKRIAALALAFALLTVAPTPAEARATTHSRYCGILSYRYHDPVDGWVRFYDKVYVKRGPVSCARARKLDYSYQTSNGTWVNRRGGWQCSGGSNSAGFYVTCKNRWSVVRGNDYQPPPPPPPPPSGPGQCADVQGYAGEYAMNILAEAVGCHEAQQVAFGDMTTPACVSDCIINVSDGNGGTDQFECTPQGNPYGAYQDELCDAGYAKVPFTLVNGP